MHCFTLAELAPLDDCGPTRGHAVNQGRQQVYRTEMNIFRLPPLKFMSAVDLKKKEKPCALGRQSKKR